MTDVTADMEQPLSIAARSQAGVPFQAHALSAVEQAVIATDLQGNILFCNRSAEKLFGWTAGEVLGWPVGKAIAAEQAASSIIQWVRRGEGWSGECPLERRDGTTFPAAVSVSPLHDTDGSIIGLVGIASDITDRKRTETELRQNEQRYRGIVEDLSELVCRFLPDGTITFVNEAYCRYFGKSREDLTGTTFWGLIPPEQHEASKQFLVEVGRQRVPKTIEHEVLRPDGQIGWQQWVDRGIYDEQGNLVEFQSVGRDVTERKRAEQALFENHERLALAQAAGRVAAFDWYPGRGVRGWSKQLELLHGLEPGSLDGDFEQWLSRVHTADREDLRRAFDGALISGELFFEYRVLWPDGEVHWLQARARTYHASPGVPERVTGVTVDITERKRAQEEHRLLEAEKLAGEALRESRERLQAALRASGTGTFRWDLRTNVFDCDESLDRLLGLPPGQSLQLKSDFIRRVHPDDRERVQTACARSISGEGDFDEEFRVVWGDGTVLWINDVGKTFLDEDGSPAYMTGACVDISARHRQQSELRALAESMPQHVWIARPDGSCDYYNQRWYDYTGMPHDRERGGNWEPYLHPDDREPMFERWRRSLETGDPFEIECRILQHQGEYHWFLGRALCMRDDSGRIARWFGTWTDIHEKKVAEDALREADRRKDEFLAMLAHELRNPLAPIKMAADLLRLAPTTDETTIWARDMIARQTGQLTRLVDDLLDVSRITRGKIELRLECLDLSAVVSQAVHASRPMFAAARLAFTATVPTHSIPVRGDTVRLAQVISNLLNNAAKYTPEGRVSLTMAQKGGVVVLAVEDTGVGIPTDMLGSVFDPFTQVPSSRDRSQGGLGLGLTLVKRIIEMHGGSVTAHSVGDGQGSTFVVHLPLLADPVVEADQATPESLPECPRQRILVVDDNLDAAESLRRGLALKRHEVEVAHDGLTAMTVAERMNPDVVLLDLGLPRLDGLEVARRLRSLCGPTRPLLVATTGFGQDEDRRRTAEAGFDHHLVKPIDLGALESLLARRAL